MRIARAFTERTLFSVAFQTIEIFFSAILSHTFKHSLFFRHHEERKKFSSFKIEFEQKAMVHLDPYVFTDEHKTCVGIEDALHGRISLLFAANEH